MACLSCYKQIKVKCQHFSYIATREEERDSCRYSGQFKLRPAVKLTCSCKQTRSSILPAGQQFDQWQCNCGQRAIFAATNQPITPELIYRLTKVQCARQQCTRCQGQGQWLVDGFSRCVNCDGSGGKKTNPCRACDGDGVLVTERRLTACTMCA